ncbi:SDR family NAD(P)-dependent oxidoreductase [Amycolatopsis thermophila]|uniref:NAD(P)-dependent dehydrogenase (Short-subunit alcohol dehydrogenase family) n=1 Tax=Amycolatopsis thermophila TaxID=206084 RepID=A0ABU0F0V9_9PSEU|nr:SDR family NAD(P)-dependent oxidoreductase [Amycolatopsis thermophila]MDQ0381146.1 NAD(P)-dependent dehydrogenase (short-subunit alcohol dehydrogenase family) [Amycolatopsis thermophila]
MRIDECAAVVTGGASGLGRATALRLAEKGARVFALDLPAAVAGAAPADGVTCLEADVTDADQVRAAVARAADGGAPLRIVVNCAGIAPSARILSRAGVHEPAVFRKVLDINLTGTFTVMTLAAEAIAATEPLADGARGVVVNTASAAAFDGQIGQAAYAASKGGVAALTLPAARDLASSGIRVMTIAPGIIDTPMMATVAEEYRAGLAAGVPFPRRFGRPEEYAELVAGIVEHDYLNGEVIRMDGAIRMAPR